MCHSKHLNQYQQNNLEILDSRTLQKFQTGNWCDLPTILLKCVCCGKGRITAPIVKFFNYDGCNLKCYDCQKELHGKRI